MRAVGLTTTPRRRPRQVAILFTGGASGQPAAPPPGVLSIRASVHGPTEKAGSPDPRWWLESEHEGLKEEFLGWVDASTEAARSALKANSSADPPVETPPVIYPYCACGWARYEDARAV